MTTKPKKPEPGLASPCKVVGVVDGDTIDVEIVRRVRVRLLDCWAPERREPGGPESGVYLKSIAYGARALLFVPTEQAHGLDDITSFGRVLGHVWLEGDRESLSERQVAAGHAKRERE